MTGKTDRRRPLFYDPSLGIVEIQRKNGTWLTVDLGGGGGGGSLSDGDKGDITVSGSGAVWTIDSQAVHLGGLVHASGPSLLLGRRAAGGGAWEEITLGTGLSMSGTTLSASGGLDHGQVKRRMLALG